MRGRLKSATHEHASEWRSEFLRTGSVIFEKEGGYHVFCPALPGCHTQSETIEEGIANIREAIELYVETLVEDELSVPQEDILIKPMEVAA